MNPNMTRRALLRLAGVSTASAAMIGAARAEGVLHLLDRPPQESEILAPGQLPFANRTPIRCGAAALRVRNLPAMVAFYRDALGLRVLQENDVEAVLGVEGVALLHLRSRPEARFERPTEAGLFHIAFLMPTRADLARWLVHAVFTRLPLTGFADHSVSEAVYLNDPEGNGLEIYSDRPRENWFWSNGVVTMGTHPLDVDSIVAMTTTERDTYEEAPDRLRIGHMHLRVGDVAAGRAYYQNLLGLDSTRGENPNSAFLSSGGYHHHVAMNTWNSAGAGARDAGATGLDWFSLGVEDAGLLEGQIARLRADGQPLAEIGGGVETADPWGTTLRLIAL